MVRLQIGLIKIGTKSNYKQPIANYENTQTNLLYHFLMLETNTLGTGTPFLWNVHSNEVTEYISIQRKREYCMVAMTSLE